MRERRIDWDTYPCDKCGLYKATDDCVCGRLDEWSENQESPEEYRKYLEECKKAKEIIEKKNLFKTEQTIDIIEDETDKKEKEEN